MTRYRVVCIALQDNITQPCETVFYTATKREADLVMDALGGYFRVTRQSKWTGGRWRPDGSRSSWTTRTRRAAP